jgi:peptide/nickel transport system permease protein
MKKAALLSLIFLTAACVLSSFAPDSLTAGSLDQRLLPPSFAHLLGTDELGRDILIRLLQGGRVSLAVAFFASCFAATIGTTAGIIAGYYGGKWDALLMRVTDFFMALPVLPLLIVVSAVDLSKIGLSSIGSVGKIILLVSLFGWVGTARLVRGRTLVLREMTFVTAARAMGRDDPSIIRTHILRNLADTVGIAAALSAGSFILMESALSFLGVGIAPPTSSWGNMLNGAENYIWEHPMLGVYPGVMIFITVLCLNALGDRSQER